MNARVLILTCLTSHTKNKSNKNDKKTFDQSDLVPIAFSVLILKEGNSKIVSQKKMAHAGEICTLKI